MSSTTDRTATMTSDTTPAPNVVAGSTEGVGTEAWKAFDNDFVSGTWQVTAGQTGWLRYDFGSPLWASDGYTVTAQTANRAPKDWTFEGSNDASSWTVLDTQTAQTFTLNQTKTYNFANLKLYRYYRLNVSANAGTSPLEVAEMQIFAPTAGGLIMGDI